MKKLFAALTFCVSTVAFAQAGQDAPSARQSETRDPLEATDLRSQTPGDSTAQAEETKRRRDEQAMGGSGKGSKLEQQGVYKTEEAFDVQGTVMEVDDDDLTLAREGLPPVELDVHNRTEVTLDGKPSRVEQLPPGAQVRAKFQLKDDDIIAVRIEATSSQQ